jgi:hypothetical protein
VVGVEQRFGEAPVADDQALDARRADALGAQQQSRQGFEGQQMAGALVEPADGRLRLRDLMGQLERRRPAQPGERVRDEGAVVERAPVGSGKRAAGAGLPAASDEVREGWPSLNDGRSCSRIADNLE